MPIKMLMARQIVDATGVPTVEVDMVTELGLFRVGVPNCEQPRRPHEVMQLRDNKESEYFGMSVNIAVKNINTIIAPEITKLGLEVTQQKEIDQFLTSLDGTECKSRLGGNAILAVSMVVAKAGAAKKGVPLYRHISDMAGVASIILPMPHFVIISGGTCASNGLPFEEYSIIPSGAPTFAEALRMGVEVYTFVKRSLIEKFGVQAVHVTDCGAFAAPLQNHRDAILFLSDAIKKLGYHNKIELAINAAASNLCKDGAYDLDFKNPNSNPQEYVFSDKLADLFVDNFKEFGIASVEDMFDLEDWGAWCSFNSRVPFQMIASDLTQTNLSRVTTCVEKKASKTVALRLSQCATITELIDIFKLLKANNVKAIVCSRLGDTDDLFLADLVVGLSAGQVKCGAPARSERVGKYNQILRIEEELGALSKFVGKNYR